MLMTRWFKSSYLYLKGCCLWKRAKQFWESLDTRRIMRAVLTVLHACCVFAIASKTADKVVVCSTGKTYDLTPGSDRFKCATSLFESLELICGGSGQFSRFKGIVSIFQEEHKAMGEFKTDLFCRCCLNQCTMDDIKSFCMSDWWIRRIKRPTHAKTALNFWLEFQQSEQH